VIYFVSLLQSKPTTSGGGRNGLRCNNLVQTRRSSRVNASPEEKEFLMKLHRFMKLRQTPIGRVPHLGFKESELAINQEWVSQGPMFVCFVVSVHRK